MFWINFIAYSAGFLTVFNMIPQVLKTCKTKSVEDVSYLLVISYALSMVLWVVYAYFISSWPIIITNGIAFFISLFQIYLMIKYKKKF